MGRSTWPARAPGVTTWPAGGRTTIPEDFQPQSQANKSRHPGTIRRYSFRSPPARQVRRGGRLSASAQETPVTASASGLVRSVLRTNSLTPSVLYTVNIPGWSTVFDSLIARTT